MSLFGRPISYPGMLEIDNASQITRSRPRPVRNEKSGNPIHMVAKNLSR